MSDDRHGGVRRATQALALEGPGATAPALRQAVARGQAPPDLQPLVDKIRRHAYLVTDEDVDFLRARYSEDELYEIIIAAAVGIADEKLRLARAALKSA